MRYDTTDMASLGGSHFSNTRDYDKVRQDAFRVTEKACTIVLMHGYATMERGQKKRATRVVN